MNKKAVFVLLGQSNATGHASPMKDEDVINVPLRNVYGLQRADNQSFENDRLIWSGYVSFGTNLAEEQDNTYSLANCLARLWQDRIDGGDKLADLYIVQIAIGAQGVTEKYMWYPEREKKLVPGVLGTVDISLYPFTTHIFSLLDKSIDGEYEIIGIHWRGGEEETEVPVDYLEEHLRDVYDRMFEGFYKALGGRVPIILHKMACTERCMDMDPTGDQLVSMNFVNKIFDSLAEDNDNIITFDVTKAPHFIKGTRTNGIFFNDACHYTPQTNMWTAQMIFDEYLRTHKC